MTPIRKEDLAAVGRLSSGIVHDVSNELIFKNAHLLGENPVTKEISDRATEIERHLMTYKLKQNLLEREFKEMGLTDSEYYTRIFSALAPHGRKIVPKILEEIRKIGDLLDKLAREGMLPENKMANYRIFDQTQRGLKETLEAYGELLGGHPLRKQNLNLIETLMRSKKVLEIARHKMGYSISVSGDAPIVKASNAAIYLAIQNIVLNAHKHGATELNVSIARELENGKPMAVMKFSDNGPGIDPNMHAKIFRPLVKGKLSSGSGMGLDVVRRIVGDHNGYVRVYNNTLDNSAQEGKGVTFEVRLPALKQRGKLYGKREGQP